MNKQEYNGWFNYETWLCALWLDNDGMSDVFREDAERIFIEALEDNSMDEEQAREDAAASLAENIKEWHEENLPEMENGFFADMLNAAMSEVNWYEIAQHYVDDCAMPETEDEDGE